MAATSHHSLLRFIPVLACNLSNTILLVACVSGKAHLQTKGQDFFRRPKLSAADLAGPKTLCFRFLWRGQRHSARLAIEILATTVVVNAGLYVSPVGRPFRLGGHARSCRQQGEGQNKGHGYYARHAAPLEVRFSDTMGRLRAMLTPANYTGLPVAPARRIPWNCQAARFRPDNRNTSSKKCAKFRPGVQCL